MDDVKIIMWHKNAGKNCRFVTNYAHDDKSLFKIGIIVKSVSIKDTENTAHNLFVDMRVEAETRVVI